VQSRLTIDTIEKLRNRLMAKNCSACSKTENWQSDASQGTCEGCRSEIEIGHMAAHIIFGIRAFEKFCLFAKTEFFD